MKRMIIAFAACVVVIGAVIGFIEYRDYKIRHQEPWKLVADCEYDKVTRMKFAASISSADGRYVRDDNFALLARAKDVHEGMSKKKVMRLLGEPSFVEGATSEDSTKFAACEWHYVFAGTREDTGYFTDRDALVVAFDEVGDVKSKAETKR